MSCSSGKSIFFSASKAKKSAKRIKSYGGNRFCYKYNGPLRPYLCRECNMYHLTSQKK